MSFLEEYADFCSCEYKAVLKHCETRWLSIRRAVMRMLQIWPSLVSYFTSHLDVEKSGKVKNISKLLNNPIPKPWLSFLGIFDKFSILFQTSSTSLIHKIQGETARLLRTVLLFCFSRHAFESWG